MPPGKFPPALGEAVDVAGKTDTKEADELNLSELGRTRYAIISSAPMSQPTDEAGRLRGNRVAVVTIN
jgi:hypothetical protein